MVNKGFKFYEQNKIKQREINDIYEIRSCGSMRTIDPPRMTTMPTSFVAPF